MRFKIKLFKDGSKNERKNVKEKYCIKCGAKIQKPRSRRFCSDKCRTRYNSLKLYRKIKDDSGYKKRRKEYHKKWRKKNRLKFNAMMKEPSRRYQMRKSQIEKLKRVNQKVNDKK